VASIVRCTNFAAVKHRQQRRKDEDQTPYINHPIGVAHLLVEAGVRDPVVLQAALLHDTVEDTDTTLEEIRGEFGSRVADVVAEVTDDKSLPKQERKRLQIEHAGACSAEAKLVKLADKLYNCTDLTRCLPTGWTEDRRQEYYRWARAVLEGGLRGTSAPLEQWLDDLFRAHIKGD